MTDGWINRDGWLKDYVNPKKKKPAEPAPQEEIKEPEYGVIFNPIRCPKCQSKEVKCYTTRPPVRYHSCNKCGCNFKSTEAE